MGIGDVVNDIRRVAAEVKLVRLSIDDLTRMREKEKIEDEEERRELITVGQAYSANGLLSAVVAGFAILVMGQIEDDASSFTAKLELVLLTLVVCLNLSALVIVLLASYHILRTLAADYDEPHEKVKEYVEAC